MTQTTKAPTTDQIRKEIDRGQAADKAAGVDPAAAPLGTDDEAGGNPPTPEQRAMEAETQTHEDPKSPSGGGDATESLRSAEQSEGLADDRVVADKPTDGGSALESHRADDATSERESRAAEVIPSREDEAAGALRDDPSPSQGRPSDAP